VGVFGWGLVAPRSPNVAAFAANLESSESWLEPFKGFGPNNFLVGVPEFSFADYRDWILERFPPNRVHQLEEKMDMPVLYAIGSFIQALEQNPGLEQELARLGSQAHVYVGTGIGNVGTVAQAALSLERAQRRWDRFWAERNPEMAGGGEQPEAPPDPAEIADPEERRDAESAWWHHWAGRCPELHDYLRELQAIEAVNVHGDVEKGKVHALRDKQRHFRQLQERWGCPSPPWLAVSANVVWNIWNTPASQISILGHITGLSMAPVAACSTFGVCLKLAMDAIRRGEAKAVVIGATDPPPMPVVVGGFYAARVISADAEVSKPLTGLRGTHVGGARSSGSSATWTTCSSGASRPSAWSPWPWGSARTPTTSSPRPPRARPRRSARPWSPPASIPRRSSPGTSTPPPRRATTKKWRPCAAWSASRW
jgi:hypothetical protein